MRSPIPSELRLDFALNDVLGLKILKDNLVSYAPLGQPGGRLWVREEYPFIGTFGASDLYTGKIESDTIWSYKGQMFKGPIPPEKLPKSLSRLTLEINDVQVKPGGALTYDNIIATGFKPREQEVSVTTGGFIKRYVNFWNQLYPDTTLSSSQPNEQVWLWLYDVKEVE